MDGLNEYRQARVAEILADFTTLQYCIAAAPSEAPNRDDKNTEGWRVLRQCAVDGQHILNTGADTGVPEAKGGLEEQSKVELQQVHLDALARRHQGQKIYLRQVAAQRWLSYRESILQGQRPRPEHREQLAACDAQLWAEINQITDELVYAEMLAADQRIGRWTVEDPSLRAVQRWIRTRQP